MVSNSHTDGEAVPCEKCGARFDPRGIGAHEAACDGEQDEKSQDGGGASDIPGREWWRDHADVLAELGGVKPQDGTPMETVLGRAWAKRTDMDAREAYIAVFGRCPVEGCENGRNGFDARTCKTHEGEHPDAGGDGDGESGDSELETVVVDGQEVTGTPEQLRAILQG